MIGQTIEARRPFPFGALVWLAVALFLVALSAVPGGGIHWAIVSVCFWTCGLLWFRTRERPFRAVFTDAELQVDEPHVAIPYNEMEALIAGRRPANPFQAGPPAYPIILVYPRGVVRLPPHLNIRSDEVYGFLYARFTSHGSRDVHPELVDYLRYQEKRFGSERVWSYRARKFLGLGLRFRRVRCVLLPFSWRDWFGSPWPRCFTSRVGRWRG
jgi:hypothetical protein